MKKKILHNVFLSSISQNVGKTTIALGLYQAFNERKIRTAFIKPVGQQVVNVGNSNIDKDSYLIGEVFHCAKNFKEMSPVTVGRGFTEKYIFHPQKNMLKNNIEKAFNALIKAKDAIIVEGTGHCGVGSVIDFSNADVAKLLHSKVIIISEGGIGKSIDEIMLNKGLFDLNGVEVMGVIINKVLSEKYEKVKRALERGLKNKGLNLLGVIPDRPLLSSPTIMQIKDKYKFELLCGETEVSRRVKHVIVAAMEPHNMVHHLEDGTLVLVSGDRIDNILLAVSSHLVGSQKDFQIAGIILTGGLMPNEKIVDLLSKSKIPVLIDKEDTYSVAAKLENLICKIEKTDKDKIAEIGRLVKKYVDIDQILELSK
ncbi:MAG: hypothetical protein A2Y03_06245 [Omnitrophica WOR_2 bacterium GWF2_38_59]|nr:MAG: hypothetical protein A2Y03_06245 [Omnitrophica WOR_2 bacterium GWF2_38_59]OGX50247.1 MAG: hypothetical protein A2243_07035 [Omnitrophica WOR_2 bacterium RIFOXYA2_FULL_38_17]OGX57269.1 MAG: hypothetical protein A2447_09960 [Omnitrophica WOR_2 bacterium RIFOXYC2_FULL_38_12]HBG61202.1 hypothetical protein [Candidatus Omnitrophota bacterium]